MANDTVNRSIVITGYDDGVMEMLQGIQEAGVEAYEKLAQGADKYAQAMGEMVGKMDEVLEKMKELPNGGGGGGSGGSGGGGGGGFGGGLAAGVGAGLGIATFASITSMIGTAFTEGRKLDEARAGLYALRGSSPNDTVGRTNNFGVSTSDMLSYERSMITTSGLSRGNKKDEDLTVGMLRAEKAWGLSEGSTMQNNQFARQGGADSGAQILGLLDTAKRSELWNIRVKDGKIAGMETLSEKMSQLNEVQNQMYQSTSGVDTALAQSMMGVMGALGGKFEDQSAGQMMGALHSGIAGGGGNEFMDAEIKTALARANPTMSAFELKKLQEQGAYGDGNIYNVLKHFETEYGKGSDEHQMAADKLLGGNQDMETIRRFTGGDVEEWKGISSQEARTKMADFQEGGGYGETIGRLDAASGELSQTEAKVQDLMAIAGAEVIGTFSDVIQDILDWGIQGLPDMIKDIRAMIAALMDFFEVKHTGSPTDIPLEDVLGGKTEKERADRAERNLKDLTENATQTATPTDAVKSDALALEMARLNENIEKMQRTGGGSNKVNPPTNLIIK